MLKQSLIIICKSSLGVLPNNIFNANSTGYPVRFRISADLLDSGYPAEYFPALDQNRVPRKAEIRQTGYLAQS